MRTVVDSKLFVVEIIVMKTKISENQPVKSKQKPPKGITVHKINDVADISSKLERGCKRIFKQNYRLFKGTQIPILCSSRLRGTG